MLGRDCLRCSRSGGSVDGWRRPTAARQPRADQQYQPQPQPQPQSPTNDRWITAERPYVKFRAPVGWSTEITPDKEWGVFRSPEGDAVFAFTTYTQENQFAVRLDKAGSVLGFANVTWSPPRPSFVGRDKFNAYVSDGACTFGSTSASAWYGKVNSGTSDQMLLILVATSAAPEVRRLEAQAAIDSLRRRASDGTADQAGAKPGKNQQVPQINQPEEEHPTGEALNANERRAKVEAAVGSANLRDAPELNSRTIKAIAVGTVVVVDMTSKVVTPGKKSANTWYRVRVPGQRDLTGWMHENVLAFE